MKIHIDIDESNLCNLVIDDNGIKQDKLISFETLLLILNNSKKEVHSRENSSENGVSKEIKEWPLLPGDKTISVIQVKECIDTKSIWYVLCRERIPTDMILEPKVFKQCGMPKMLFAVKVFDNRVANLKIVCVKDDFINNKSKIYSYPFSNVFENSVCLGGNRLNDFFLGDLTNLYLIPEMFLAMKNNHHAYQETKEKGAYSELLDKLEYNEFDEDILKEHTIYKNYESFYKSLK